MPVAQNSSFQAGFFAYDLVSFKFVPPYSVTFALQLGKSIDGLTWPYNQRNFTK
jgi:hypothetical protein